MAKKRPKKASLGKNIKKRSVRPSSRKISDNKPVKDDFKKQPTKSTVSKTRDLFHKLYFGKKHQETAVKTGQNQPKNKIDQKSEERVQEIRLNEIQKSGDSMELVGILKKLVEDLRSDNESLRKENQELRKEKQLMNEKMKNIPTYDEDYGRAPAVEKLPEKQKQSSYNNYSQKNVETSMDTLLELVIRKGSIKLPQAAKELHTKESEIDELARVLEEHELIQIHYPTIGKPVLRKKPKSQ